ncbi:DUF3306 domain-containing protein [Kaarinaea lacus]
MKNPKPSSFGGQEQRSAEDEPFLRRWSKRKLDGSATTEERVDETQASLTTAEQQPEPSRSDPALDQPQVELTDDDMPPVDTLDENSDFSGFLSPKVSETLRRQALRKLFHFQQFNITDGLNDYDGDYTKFEKLGDVITHEMQRLMEREAEALQAKVINRQIQHDTVVLDAPQTDNNDNSFLQNEASNRDPDIKVEMNNELDAEIDAEMDENVKDPSTMNT